MINIPEMTNEFELLSTRVDLSKCEMQTFANWVVRALRKYRKSSINENTQIQIQSPMQIQIHIPTNTVLGASQVQQCWQAAGAGSRGKNSGRGE